MSKKKIPLKPASILVCDFETTTDGTKTQAFTEVWASATIDLNTEDDPSNVLVTNSLETWFSNLFSYKSATAFFHNEKFDGSFIISGLFEMGFTVAMVDYIDSDGNRKQKMATRLEDMPNESFTCLISDKGIWYTITIKHKNRIYRIKDSYKLLPFSVKALGKGFNTQHRKLDMEYVGERHAGGIITPEEEAYIKNDVLVVKECLNFMFNEGHKKLTIGSCCMNEFKKGYGKYEFGDLFPNLYGDNFRLSKDVFGSDSAGEYIRKSYKGGWCYLMPEKANKVFEANIDFNGTMIAGTTADVNSLYPSSQHSRSGNRYAVGYPTFWKGDIPPEIKADKNLYYFIRVKTRFYIKERHLPTIQIKHSPLYPPRKWLTSSDYIDVNGNAWREIQDDINGGMLQMIPELTLTKTDWELMQEHYNLEDTEILDGCWFETRIGLFDEYIDKYAEIKMREKGPKRQLAKLLLNNCYGRFSTSTDASKKVPFMGEDGIVHFYTEPEESIKKGAYIAIGSAITSYSRAFTIRAAQCNYDNFVYSDTDSIHLTCHPDDIKGAPEHPTMFNHWKYESCWDRAIFVRAKTYIEHVTHEDREVVDPYYNVKCAGMPDRAKDNFISKMELEPLTDNDDINEYCKKVGVKNPTESEIAFYKTPKMDITDFKIDLCVPGSLKPKRIKGGVVLINSDYVMRPNKLIQ